MPYRTLNKPHLSVVGLFLLFNLSLFNKSQSPKIGTYSAFQTSNTKTNFSNILVGAAI